MTHKKQKLKEGLYYAELKDGCKRGPEKGSCNWCKVDNSENFTWEVVAGILSSETLEMAREPAADLEPNEELVLKLPYSFLEGDV